MANNLQSKVMRRINFIYYTRQIFQPLVLNAAALAFFVGLVGAFVSVEQVFRNMLTASDLSEFVAFVWSAFTRTELSVQALLLGAAIFLVTLAIEFCREVKREALVRRLVSVRI